ncbi:hypothetical protein BaRGS_00019573, partial [Batillaria attramentaria]
FVDQKLSQKILTQARKQQEELEDEHGPARSSSSKSVRKAPKQVSLGARRDDSDSDDDLPVDDGDMAPVVVDEADEKAIEAFMSKTPKVNRTLADIINEKLTEKKTEIQTVMSDDASVQLQDLDERLVRIFQGVGEVLRKYRSGKLPKAFKTLPASDKWEQILYVTKPEQWSAAAMYQATRIFASNLSASLAQRFFYLVLLPRIRDDIVEYKRLNFHLFMALKKALFKPAAFFKGILLPMCEAGDCTLREANIVSSVLRESSIPMVHSAVAVYKIAEMDYNGANSIFLRTLLDKKYAFPYQTVDAVVAHFMRFIIDKRKLPVLWHQCLLTFVQRYKRDLAQEQKEQLYELLRKHDHPEITPEVRRELQNSVCRGEDDPNEQESGAMVY